MTGTRPPVLLVVCCLIVLEAAAFAGLGLAVGAELVRGRATMPGATAFLAVCALGVAALLGLCARGLWRGRRWARSPVIMWQILLVVLALGWYSAEPSVVGARRGRDRRGDRRRPAAPGGRARDDAAAASLSPGRRPARASPRGPTTSAPAPDRCDVPARPATAPAVRRARRTPRRARSRTSTRRPRSSRGQRAAVRAGGGLGRARRDHPPRRACATRSGCSRSSSSRSSTSSVTASGSAAASLGVDASGSRRSTGAGAPDVRRSTG